MATSAEATRPADTIAFAHNSERQFARLLDFYRVEWEYEPTAFPVEWDAAGHVTQQFRPDFYLPRFDLYIEITTLNQRLVTKKNRKVRRLRELYPDVHIKVLYQRDYLSLLAKYGLEPPSQMLDPATQAAEEPAMVGAAGEAEAAGTAAAAAPNRDRRRAARPARGGSGRVGSAGEGSGGPGSGPRESSGPSDRRATQGSGAVRPDAAPGRPGGGPQRPGGAVEQADGVPGAPERPSGPPGRPGGAPERVRGAGRPRVVPDPPGPVPPLPADPELVRLAQVLLPAERAHRRGPATAKRAG